MPEIQSTIVEVTVYPDRARVTRRGKVDLEPGTHRITFASLPLSLAPDSVRAAGRGTAAASLLGVETQRTYFTETPSIPAQELERQIEALTDEDGSLADQMEEAQSKAAMMKSLAENAAKQMARLLTRGSAEIAQAAALVEFTQQQLSSAHISIRETDIRRRELSRRLAQLQNELFKHQRALPRERFDATVEVEVSTAGDLTVDLTYVLDGAGWKALYDIRLEEGDSPSLQLSYLGQVTQSTGEDWENITLTLSTARPALTTIRPELSPWYLSSYVPVPPPPQMRVARMSVAPAGGPTTFLGQGISDDLELAAAPAPAQAPLIAELKPPPAEVSSSGASVTFKLPQTVNIPSDGSPHKVNISAFDFPPKLDFISVPKLAECAYRRAKATNSSDSLLLEGQANLFVAGDFVGSSQLKQVAPGEEFELTLGVDDRVAIKRELKARDVDKKLLADRRRLRIAYEIEIQSLHDQPVHVEIHDQSPVAQHEQIRVKLESVDPRPAEQSEFNEFEWQLTLNPGAKRVLRFEFTIEHPTGLMVTGLP